MPSDPDQAVDLGAKASGLHEQLLAESAIYREAHNLGLIKLMMHLQIAELDRRLTMTADSTWLGQMKQKLETEATTKMDANAAANKSAADRQRRCCERAREFYDTKIISLHDRPASVNGQAATIRTELHDNRIKIKIVVGLSDMPLVELLFNHLEDDESDNDDSAWPANTWSPYIGMWFFTPHSKALPVYHPYDERLLAEYLLKYIKV